MTLSVLFLGAFLLGLALAVFSMLHGVQRPAHATLDPPTATERTVSLPMAEAFAATFGATGYLLTRYTTLSPLPRLVIACAAGATGAFAAAALVAKWALARPSLAETDVRYLLQGHLARVTTAIGAAAAGQISYEVDGTPYAARALSIDGTPVETGTDVVIDRVEDGLAFVEPWTRVEQRL